MKLIIQIERKPPASDRIEIQNELLGTRSSFIINGQLTLVDSENHFILNSSSGISSLRPSIHYNSFSPLNESEDSFTSWSGSHNRTPSMTKASFFDNEDLFNSSPYSNSLELRYPRTYEVPISIVGFSHTKKEIEELIKQKMSNSFNNVKILKYEFEITDRFTFSEVDSSHQIKNFKNIDPDEDLDLFTNQDKYKVPTNWTDKEIIDNADLSLAGPSFYPNNSPLIQAILRTYKKERDNGLPSLEVAFRRATAAGEIKHLTGLAQAEHPIKIDAQDTVGTSYTALHLAAKFGHQNIYNLLLKMGANPDIVDAKGNKASAYLKTEKVEANDSGFDYKKIFSK